MSVSGASGPGFIGGGALILLLIAVVFCLSGTSMVRDAFETAKRELREYFSGSQSSTATAEEETTPAPKEGPATGLASDRDTYDFDLSLLADSDE